MNQRIVFAVHGIISGVDVLSVNMAAELRRRNMDARILMTAANPQLHSLPIPPNVSMDLLPVRRKDPWPSRWRTLIRYLESQAPCIFIPNYDSNYSCVSPRLSRRIIVVGIVHSDDPVHFEHAMRMGKYWNGVVSVSNAIAKHLEILRVDMANRSRIIPCGVEVPDSPPDRAFTNERPLRIVYAGRLAQHQKCVLDLPQIFQRLQAKNVPVEITLIGDGPDRTELERRCASLMSSGIVHFSGTLPNKEVLKNFETQDSIILTSDFEGMPLCLLEAMARGCVPVVTNIRSGIPELVRDGVNGFLVKRGDMDTFVKRFRLLQQNREIRQTMSQNAHQTIQEKFSLKGMVDDYLEFFDYLEEESNAGHYRRPSGPIPYPPWMKIGWKDYMPVTMRRAGGRARKLLRKTRFLFHRDHHNGLGGDTN